MRYILIIAWNIILMSFWNCLLGPYGLMVWATLFTIGVITYIKQRNLREIERKIQEALA